MHRATAANMAQYGFSKLPTTATMLTNNAICDSIIAIHNASEATDTMWQISTVAPLIAHVGTSYFLETRSRDGSGVVTFVYDSTLALKLRLIED
ncbi:MAG TPA: hypothetical protein VGM77_02060 [Gemmatimonadales bacterium]|jgi:hypothetical protein